MKLIVGQKRAVVTIDATRLSNKEPKAHFLIGRKQTFLCRGIVNQLSFDVMIEPRWLRHQQHFVSGDAFTKIGPQLPLPARPCSTQGYPQVRHWRETELDQKYQAGHRIIPDTWGDILRHRI